MNFQKLLVIQIGFLIAVVSSNNSTAQVCATPGLSGPNAGLSGTLNSYYPGTGASVSIGATSIPVGAIDTTGGGAATAIATGDLLIVMQMQGAQINNSNSDCYGDGVGTAGCATRLVTTGNYAGGNTTSNYLAGNWEYCTAIGPVAAGSVAVRCAGGAGTVNAYTASAATAASGAYRYQVIRVPQYSSATLTGTVTSASWNGSTGGVASLQVAGTLTMGGNAIDASRRGFRGGGNTLLAPGAVPSVLDPVNGTTFYRAVAGAIPGGEVEGSFKGEGIAGTPRLVYNGTAQVDTGTDGYPSGSRGRGAPGNAGGGGENQNSGGAGGGNGGLGGNGGGGWNDASRPNTFRDSGGHGGDGNSRAGNNLSLGVNRIIMGGGGGAGHVDGGGTNCQNGGWGGNGGGIVIVKAGSFSGTGSLLADGNDGFRPNTAGSCTDAAGGAGAGGSVYVANDTGSLASLTINARGGNGVNSSYAEHGPGGGGGGGAVRYTSAGGVPVITVTGGTNGRDANGVAQAGFPATPQAWFSTPGANSAIASAATPAASTTPPSTTCFPNLTVSKSTTTPSITAATGATATYSVVVTNSSSGAAIGSSVVDNALPTNWTAGAVSAVTFSPALSATVLGGYVESATAGQPAVANAPGGPANLVALATAPSSTTAPFFRNLTIPGNGTVTLTYAATIPDTAGIGTYHNSAGVQFLDPTRTTATRVVTATTNNTANRCSSPGASTTGCSASGNSVAATTNTTYEAGAAAVAGSQYSGLVAGNTGEDVVLLPDLSITKTASAASFTIGAASQSYTIVGRNNGRAIANQVFNTNQATDALATALVAPTLSITDTLPTGITVSSVTSSVPAVWTCTPNGGSTAFTCTSSAAVYPVAAATDIVTVTVNVAVAATACPGPNNNTTVITTPALGEVNAVNNSGSVSTTSNCSANLSVTKTDGTATVVSGGSTVYTITVTNAGPAAADGALVTDTPSAGLSCAVTSCTPTAGAVCPAAGAWPNLLAGGLTIATLPSSGMVSFGLTCSVTATGF
ncbi:MAG: hypothetical protein ABI644_13020 [Arenimonas sp.]